MHRTITVGAKSPLCQVILKNTSVREAAVSGNGSHINRSQSLYTTNSRIPVLAPSRAERARLEALLADVWTRDVLPFPGMTVRSRSEQLVRASASSVMRRLSSVSITGRFAKRSSSFPSLLQLKGAGSSPVSGEETSRRSKEEPRPETPASHQPEEVRMSPLSMIPDETERSSPSLAPSAASPGSDPCAISIGLVRRRRGKTIPETRPTTPIEFHRPSTESSPRLSLQRSTLSETSSASGDLQKETYCAAPNGGSRKAFGPLHELPGKKAKKGGRRHRGAVFRSIRNIFR
jgi:hypothetical protein